MKNTKSTNIYHIFNKSIANFAIFRNHSNSLRFVNVLAYYNQKSIKRSYSDEMRRKKSLIKLNIIKYNEDQNLIKILSYCVMPDHYHLLIKFYSYGLSKYISDVENSYTRYFNIKYKRKGPLWQTRYKHVKIINNEQLLHVSRYIHLNPVTNKLVDKPEDWVFSSYKHFITNNNINDVTEISIKSSKKYKRFVEDQIDYQRRLKLIKRHNI